MNNDLISREALKKAFEDCAGECACCVHNTNDFAYCGLIDNTPTVKAYTEEEVQEIREEVAKEFKDIIDNAPTVEEPYKDLYIDLGYEQGYERGKNERPHGEWINHEEGYNICPLCKYKTAFSYNFCPNCGADMRGEEDGK